MQKTAVIMENANLHAIPGSMKMRPIRLVPVTIWTIAEAAFAARTRFPMGPDLYAITEFAR